MRVNVDDARRDDQAADVDPFLGRFVGSAERDDAAVTDPDVGGTGRRTGAVDHDRVFEQHVEHVRPPI